MVPHPITVFISQPSGCAFSVIMKTGIHYYEFFGHVFTFIGMAVAQCWLLVCDHHPRDHPRRLSLSGRKTGLAPWRGKRHPPCRAIEYWRFCQGRISTVHGVEPGKSQTSSIHWGQRIICRWYEPNRFKSAERVGRLAQQTHQKNTKVTKFEENLPLSSTKLNQRCFSWITNLMTRCFLVTSCAAHKFGGRSSIFSRGIPLIDRSSAIAEIIHKGSYRHLMLCVQLMVSVLLVSLVVTVRFSFFFDFEPRSKWFVAEYIAAQILPVLLISFCGSSAFI